MTTPTPLKQDEKKCDWCGKPLGEIYFTDNETKKSFHFNFQGKDCLKSFMNKNK